MHQKKIITKDHRHQAINHRLVKDMLHHHHLVKDMPNHHQFRRILYHHHHRFRQLLFNQDQYS